MAMKHYEGEHGIFDYDDEEFDINDWRFRYIGKETDGSKIKIPDGAKKCLWLFSESNITTPPVIPDSVECGDYMFASCASLRTPPVIPDTMKNCFCMFANCTSLKNAPIIPVGVEDCGDMFNGCSLRLQKEGKWNIKHRGESYRDFVKKYSKESYPVAEHIKSLSNPHNDTSTKKHKTANSSSVNHSDREVLTVDNEGQTGRLSAVDFAE